MPTAVASQGVSRHDLPANFLDAKREAASRFLSAESSAVSAYAVSTRPRHNVVGVGIGMKISKGKVTGRRCVRFYVERKVAPEAIGPEYRLPVTLNGVPTDVIETGRFRALPAKTPVGQQKLRPARPGSSVGFQYSGAKAGYVMAGTFGAVVSGGGTTYILSNNHVLADENALAIGSAIFQPGLLDHGNPAKDQVARLTRFITLKAGPANAVDAAIAEVVSAALGPQPAFGESAAFDLPARTPPGVHQFLQDGETAAHTLRRNPCAPLREYHRPSSIIQR